MNRDNVLFSIKFQASASMPAVSNELNWTARFGFTFGRFICTASLTEPAHHGSYHEQIIHGDFWRHKPFRMAGY